MDAATIRNALSAALGSLGVPVEPRYVPLEFPTDIAHGDYASSIAMTAYRQLARSTDSHVPGGKHPGIVWAGKGGSPKELAQKIITELGELEGVDRMEVAGPGFINFTLKPEVFASAVADAASAGWGRGSAREGEEILFEYTDPNPFKAFHIGHLMSNAIGESLSRLAENQGARVIRANYQGDVGVHVACAIWGIKKLGIHPESADEFGIAYATGATAYKEDAAAKAQIDAINTKLYDRSDAALNKLYDAGRKESLMAFEKIYSILGTRFDRYYFESETAPIGKEIVEANPGIFVESDGARVFKGEEYGLHTRVFLSSKNLPTYEAKELGLETLKQSEYPDAAFVIVTANEVTDYFRVVKKALELIDAPLAAKLTHIAHGMMKLPSGKMSSRTGSVVTGESLLNELSDAARERAKESRADDIALLAQQVAIGAIKFQILRGSSSKDIVFDREQALSLEGDSGPYLQYAYARTRAILVKAKDAGVAPKSDTSIVPNTVARLLVRFPAVAERAAREYAPHHVSQYLLELASAFNSWYAQEQILDGTPGAAHKVALTAAVGNTLKHGLWLLGIPAPEKM